MSVLPTTTGTRSLVTKLSEVMNEVGRIPKNGTNSFHNYKYVKESDLVEKLSELLAARHVFITSDTKGIETVELQKTHPKTGEVTTTKMGILRVEYTFHDGESGEKLTVQGVGEIDQDGGKGLYKALTGAMKYFLMKSFLVATGDDPEQTPAKIEQKAAVAKPELKKKAEKAPPTSVFIMEALTQQTLLSNLVTIYDQAFKYPWTPEDADSITQTFLSCYSNLSNWKRNGDMFFSDAGLMNATVDRTDPRGWVKVVENTALIAEEKAAAEAERVGKTAELTSGTAGTPGIIAAKITFPEGKASNTDKPLSAVFPEKAV